VDATVLKENAENARLLAKILKILMKGFPFHKRAFPSSFLGLHICHQNSACVGYTDGSI